MNKRSKYNENHKRREEKKLFDSSGPTTLTRKSLICSIFLFTAVTYLNEDLRIIEEDCLKEREREEERREFSV